MDTKRDMKKENKKPVSWKYVIPFFVVLLAMTVLAFTLPLRPERSYTEKRKLTEFPDFSREALVSGSYFDDITLWFSDTYPGREGWLKMASHMEELHGKSEIVISGDITVGDQIPDTPVAEKPAESTAPTVSASVETTVPETTAPPVQPTEHEVVAPPEAPVEEWGGVDAGEDAEVMLGAVVQIGDTAFNYYGFSEYWGNYYAESLNKLAKAVEPQGVRVISALVPTSIGIMVEKEYMEKLQCGDQEKSIDYMLSQMDDGIVKVDMFQNLVDHNDEYLYFRTDHHWTGLGAYYGYESICEAAGMEAAPLDAFEEWDQGEFEGSIYWSSGNPSKLRLDNVYAYNPPGDLEMWISDSSDSSFPWPVLTDMSASDKYSKYMTFLAGDHALTKIVNHDLPEGKTCVMIKDSYGNPVAPLLTQNYHTVYVIDYRKYFTMNIQNFAEQYDVDDVIFLNGLGMAVSEGTNQLIASLCGR